jgi:hypothetical protein
MVANVPLPSAVTIGWLTSVQLTHTVPLLDKFYRRLLLIYAYMHAYADFHLLSSSVSFSNDEARGLKSLVKLEMIYYTDGKWRRHIDVLSVMEQKSLGIEELGKLYVQRIELQWITTKP